MHGNMGKMSSTCSTHPDRNSTGACARCGMRTCELCNVDVGGARYCSIVCFTEQALEAKGKKLQVKGADPLAEVKLKDDSVVLGAHQAQADESSLVLPEQQDDATSILDMAAAMKPPSSKPDESSVTPVEGRMKEPTSILGMHELARRAPDGTWLDEPPTTETPLPILLPGTRRSTIESTCVFHPDTPAVVMCSLCGDAICTLCIQDEDQGGRCSPGCRRDRAQARKKRLLIVAAAVAAVLVAGAAFRPKKTAPAPEARVETPAEFEARAREAERVRLETEAREEARKRIEAREREERERLEAIARAKAAEEARIAAVAKAEADARESLAKAEAEAKLKADALAKAEALASEALRAKEAEAKAKEEAARAAEEAARAAKAAARAKAEAEAKAKAEAEARAKAEALASETLRAKEAEAKAKAEAEAEAKRRLRAEAAADAVLAAKAKAEKDAAEKQLAIETSFRKASGLIREATPDFCTLAEQAADAGQATLPRIDAVVSKLSGARSEYAWLADHGASDLVQRRITIL